MPGDYVNIIYLILSTSKITLFSGVGATTCPFSTEKKVHCVTEWMENTINDFLLAM